MSFLVNGASFLTEGAGYTITFGDVMAGVIPIILGVLTYFIKTWFNGVNQESENLKKLLKENSDAVNKRIDKVEEKYDGAIASIRDELSSVEKDFPLIYVNREEYFRTMNVVESKINSMENKIVTMDGKIDQLLFHLQNNKS